MKTMKFYAIGALVALVMALGGFPLVLSVRSLDTTTYFAAVGVAFLCMVASQSVRQWGMTGRERRFLISVSIGMGVKLAVFIASYLYVRLATDLPAGVYLLTLTAAYFVLYVYEMVFLALTTRSVRIRV